MDDVVRDADCGSSALRHRGVVVGSGHIRVRESRLDVFDGCAPVAWQGDELWSRRGTFLLERVAVSDNGVLLTGYTFVADQGRLDGVDDVVS